MSIMEDLKPVTAQEVQDMGRRIVNQRKQLATLNALVKELQDNEGRPAKIWAKAWKKASPTERQVALKMLEVIGDSEDGQEIAMAIHTIEDALNWH